METAKKETRQEQILNFNPRDWEFRRSSGYAGYDHKDHPNDESMWIYERDYFERIDVKSKYEKEYKLLSSFRGECLPFGKYPEYVLQEFLNKRFFDEDGNLKEK